MAPGWICDKCGRISYGWFLVDRDPKEHKCECGGALKRVEAKTAENIARKRILQEEE